MLVCYGAGIQDYEVTVAGRGSREQAARMAELANNAFACWKREGHPGWTIDSMDSHHLQQLGQQQVAP